MVVLFKNWKTTSSAVAAVLGYFLMRKGIILSPDFADAFALVASSIGLLFAGDAKKAPADK